MWCVPYCENDVPFRLQLIPTPHAALRLFVAIVNNAIFDRNQPFIFKWTMNDDMDVHLCLWDF